MANFTKQLLSGSTNGTQIVVTGYGTATAVTVHTAVAGTAALDEVWLYAYNDDTATRTLSVAFGGTVTPNNVIRTGVPSRSGRILVCDGMLLQNGLVVKAYADGTNVVMLDGFVNNIA